MQGPGRENRKAHCRAARTICALRSRKLASRFSAESSHTARPPASSGAGSAASALASGSAATRSSRRKREMSVSGLRFADGAVVVAVRAPAPVTAAVVAVVDERV